MSLGSCLFSKVLGDSEDKVDLTVPKHSFAAILFLHLVVQLKVSLFIDSQTKQK